MANAAAECIWLRQLLSELHFDIKKAMVPYCDNVSAVYMSLNPIPTSVRSTLNSTFILSGNEFNSATFEFFMSRPASSTRTP